MANGKVRLLTSLKNINIEYEYVKSTFTIPEGVTKFDRVGWFGYGKNYLANKMPFFANLLEDGTIDFYFLINNQLHKKNYKDDRFKILNISNCINIYGSKRGVMII